MTPTTLAKMVGAIPPYADPDLDDAIRLLAGKKPTLEQIASGDLYHAIRAITSYQYECRKLKNEIVEIEPSANNAHMREFGL
jgi:hypothetical protein